MTCQRCHGLMVREWLRDPIVTEKFLEAQRCVNCGHIHEGVMDVNRRTQGGFHDHTR